MAVRIADTLKQQNNLTTFPVAYGEDIWLDENKGSGTADYDTLQNLYNDGKLGGSSIQVKTMPTASADYFGNIVQFVGESGSYKKGHFYECIHNVTDVSNLYEWQEVNHLRFNHTIYNMTTEPINNNFTAGDVIYYTGESTENFKANHFYRALPNATPQTVYQVDMKESALVGSIYNCYTPFELRIGFIIFPTGTGGEETPYQITHFDDNGIIITPYGWSGSEITYVGASYSTTVLGWEELEGGGGTSIFYGTMDEWDALTTDQKKQYDYMADEQVGGDEILPYDVDATLKPKIQFYGVVASTGTGSFKRLKLSDNISILICPNVGTVTGTSSSGEARCTFFFPKTNGKKYNLIAFSARQSLTATAYLGYSEFKEMPNDWRVDFYMYDCSANNGIYCTATVLEYTA